MAKNVLTTIFLDNLTETAHKNFIFNSQRFQFLEVPLIKKLVLLKGMKFVNKKKANNKKRYKNLNNTTKMQKNSKPVKKTKNNNIPQNINQAPNNTAPVQGIKKPKKKSKKLFTKKFSELTPKEKEVYLKRKQRKLQKQRQKINKKTNQTAKSIPNQRPNQRSNKKRKFKLKFKDPYAYDPKKDPYNPYYQNDGIVKGNTIKNNRKHKRRHKKNYILYYILFSIITTITLYTLSITVWFEIENITVVGNTEISHEEIITTSNINLYENLIKLSKNSASKKISDTYITIDSVNIHKKLPNTVEIEIEMAQPKVLLYYDRIYYTLSESNRIIGFDTKNNFSKENLISFIVDDLEGIDLGYYLKDFNQDVLEDVDRLLVAIEENEFNTINYVDVSNISDIRFYASNLYEIKAGGFSEISYKLHCAKSIIDLQLEGYTQEGIIDVSVDNGIYYFRPTVDIAPNITK